MSKKLILSLALSGLVLTSTAQTTVAPAIPRDEKIEQQIETLLKKMTLDEKVGQMCELTIDLLQKRANPFAGLDPKNITVKDLQKIIKRYKLEKEFKLGKEMPSQDVMMKLYMRIQGIENAKGFQLDEAMLDSVIGKYKVGSILNVPNGVAQSVEKRQEIIKPIHEKSMELNKMSLFAPIFLMVHKHLLLCQHRHHNSLRLVYEKKKAQVHIFHKKLVDLKNRLNLQQLS